MTKNEIITKVIEKLLYQRQELTDAFKEINYNELNFTEKRIAIEGALYNIDMQIDRRIMDCEPFFSTERSIQFIGKLVLVFEKMNKAFVNKGKNKGFKQIL